MCWWAKLKPRASRLGAGRNRKRSHYRIGLLLSTAQGSKAERKARKWEHTGKVLEGSPKEQFFASEFRGESSWTPTLCDIIQKRSTWQSWWMYQKSDFPLSSGMHFLSKHKFKGPSLFLQPLDLPQVSCCETELWIYQVNFQVHERQWAWRSLED